MKTVLTVDDSKVVRSMVARHLQPYGCRVLEAANGEEGVAAAREHRPDLILLDVTMPVMDGREALGALRADPACKAIPVIMLTAESGKDLVLEIARLGVTGYIVKPFQKETFDKEVSKVLGPPGAAAIAAAPAADAPVDVKTVLVVDDSEKVLDAARAALEATMTVLLAHSGQEALEQYDRGRPGVVVIDLAMPEMDGFETLERLRGRGRSAYVALAVRGDDGLHERARKAGYHAVVAKPFRAGNLVDSVLAAANAVAAPEQLLGALFGEDGDCPVMRMPDPRSKVLARVGPALTRRLRDLAEQGTDKLILDLGAITEVTTEVVSALAHLIAAAGGVGIRTAICAPDATVMEKLKQFAETKDTLYGPSLEQARQRLD
ncbi:MAG TPA: response regulator [Candidatus Binatia bacterium]|nr:response regulator [Candidatus Binatia bacterium]